MAWYNSSWSKRKKVTLTGGTSGAQTDYRCKFTVTYDSDMQADFDDLRFTKLDGTTLLDAWLESKTDSTSAVVRVETDTPANGVDADIYMYYGNSSVASKWNIENTFLFGDDFRGVECLADNAITHWREEGGEYYNGTYDRTYITWLETGTAVKIAYYDHTSESWSSTVTIASGLSSNDHQAPSILVIQNNGAENGKILVATGYTTTKIWKSNSSEDISAWTNVHTTDGSNDTYPNLAETTNGGLWLFYRGTDDDEWYCKSTDGGANWSSKTEIIAFGNVYAKVAYSGAEIHIEANDRSTGDHKNIYYMYSSDHGSTWKKRDGTSITLPATASTMDLVFTTATGQQTRDCGIHLDSSNNPAILSVDDIDNTRMAKYHYYSSGWQTDSIVATSTIGTSSDESYDCIDPLVHDAAYIAVPVSGSLEIQRWKKSGGSWSKDSDITSASYGDNFRVIPIRNAHSDLKIFWSYAVGYAGHDDTQWGSPSTIKTHSIQGGDTVGILDFDRWDEDAVNSITDTINDYFRFEDCTRSGTTWWVYDGTDTGSQHQAKCTLPTDFVLEWTSTISNTVNNYKSEGGVAIVADDDTMIFVGMHFDGSSTAIIIQRGILVESAWGDRWSQNMGTGTTSDECDYKIERIGTTLKGYVDGSLKIEKTTASTVSKIALMAGGDGSYPFVDHIQIDNVRVSQYVANPATYAFGSEESEVTDVYCTLALSNTITPTAQATTGAALTLNQIANVADGGQANTSATTTLADLLGISESAVADALAALTLPQTVAVAQNAQATAEAAVSLPHTETLTSAATATAEVALSLGAGVTISTGATAVTEATLSLANFLAVSQITGQYIDVDLALTASLGITEAAIIAAEAALTFAHGQALTEAAGETTGASLSLAQILEIAQITGQEIDVSLSLSQSLGTTASAQAVADASLLLPKTVAVSQSAAATTAASLAIAYHAALTSTTGGSVSATLALAMQQGISATTTVDYGAALSISQSLGTTSAAQATTAASLTLDQNLSLVLIAQAVAEAGLTLNAIQSVTQTATTIIIGLITPDGRTLIITFENRTLIVPAAN